jgi:hypothetical protein
VTDLARLDGPATAAVGEPGFRCWVARDGDRLAGFATASPPGT